MADFFSCHLLELCVVFVEEDLFAFLITVQQVLVGLAHRHEFFQVFVFLGQFDIAFLIADDVGVGNQGTHFGEAGMQAVKLF